MPEPRKLVLGTGSSPAEDELRLPRPPGVIRRFWARHPLLADSLIAVVATLVSLPAVTVRAVIPEPSTWAVGAGIALSFGACVVLVWRRRWPVTVFIGALMPSLVIDPVLGASSGPAALIALYSVAVYRGVRACWIVFGVAVALIGASALVYIWVEPTATDVRLNVDLSTVVMLLLGALIGINVGNRRRYLNALIDRSRQLLIERDQQARLAAAAERTRIAREMHDIVSHSLTVVVALAEGAAATPDRARSDQAVRAIAGTAREALTEMRVMLGVLRDDEASPLLAPVDDGSVHDVVESARAAGTPVRLRLTGDPDAPPAIRLAIIRVVQEGLTNALRYSRDPSVVAVSIAYLADRVEVSIENDGAIADAPSEGAGLGIRGLQERVAHVRGTMSAGMIAPGIWRLHATLPHERRSDA